MASSNQHPRSPSRRMSPFVSSPNGFKMQPDAPQVDTTGGWIEPPLRQPVPSFQDHGLGRVGVVENMMPLGAPPTTRVKAKAKGDPLRKVMQARHLSGSGMVLDDSRSTPEAVAENTRNGSARTDGQPHGSSNIDPQLMIEQMDFSEFTEPTYRPHTPADSQSPAPGGQLDNPQSPQIQLLAQQQQPQVAQMHPYQTPQHNTQPYTVPQVAPRLPSATPNMQQSHLSAAPFPASASSNYLSSAPSIVPPGSPFFTANSIAKRSGMPEVQQPLAYLYAQLQQDAELQRLLREACRDESMEDPVNDRKSELGKKIKRVKKNYRAQANGPLYRSPFTTVFENETPRQASSVFGSPLKQNQTTMASSSPQTSLHQHLRSTSTSLPQRLSSSKMTSHALQSASGDDAPTGQPLISSRRASSSSSLSSTSSRKIEALGASAAQTNPLKRTVDEAGSLLDASDDRMEAQRKRMRRDFSAVDVADSSIRKGQSSARHATSAGSAVSPQRSTPKLRYWPPGVRTEVADTDETGAGEGPATPTALGRPPSSKKKVAPRTKMSPVKNERKASVAGLARPETRRRGSFGDDDKIEGPIESDDESDDDICAACGGPGFLLCCDGCDRSFHFTCLDPPRDPDDTLEGQWFCPDCEAQRDTLKRPPRGIFADLQYNIDRSNPRAFTLPQIVRDHYRDIKTGSNGEYITSAEQRPIKGGRIGYDNENVPDYRKTRDAKGNAILCYSCGKSALGGRDIIPCDYCPLNWHLDCLNPPLANPPYRGNFTNAEHKTRPAWMCPAHVEHEIKNLDPVTGGRARPPQLPNGAKTHRMRRPISATIMPVHMRRGFANNGMIEVESDSDDSGYDSEENAAGVVFKLPRQGIKLDFIDKVKQNRLAIERTQREAGATLHIQAEKLRIGNEQQLSQDIAKRHFAERVAAFNLVQFREGNQDLKLGKDELENLLHTLVAEAPSDVIAAMSSRQPPAPKPTLNHDTRHKKKRRPVATVSKGLPSPSPTASRAMSEVKDPNERQREILVRMQTQIQQLLAAGDAAVAADRMNGV